MGYNYIYNTDIANKTYSNYIKKCYSSGEVIGTGSNVGGLIGYLRSTIYTNNNYIYAYNYIQESYSTRKSFINRR
ncbi:hypothetical protein D3C72_1911490 [compost metagenome]